MATAANILLIIASILMAIAAFSSYKLHAKSKSNNSTDVLAHRARALAAGVAAIILASIGIALNGGDTEIWIGAMVLIAISLATIAQAATYNMYSAR